MVTIWVRIRVMIRVRVSVRVMGRDMGRVSFLSVGEGLGYGWLRFVWPNGCVSGRSG